MANKEKTSKKAIVGTVVSDKMEKTVVVEVVRMKQHPVYRKIVKYRKRFYAHDELGAKAGDKVAIRESRPLSKMKRFVTVEIINGRAKKPAPKSRFKKK